MPSLEVTLARVHDLLDDGGPAAGEHRALVDRLWPRGVRKDRLVLDRWAKDAAPSTELRRAFHHDEVDVEQFAERYRAELADTGAADALAAQAREAGARRLVLVHAAKDSERNHARVLREALLADG